ncbi:hypothetical protein BHE74_00057766 [Ensete ventricosum]|nr:hypothetical protein BHE74_00057766 [Ensete ventricosum]
MRPPIATVRYRSNGCDDRETAGRAGTRAPLPSHQRPTASGTVTYEPPKDTRRTTNRNALVPKQRPRTWGFPVQFTETDRPGSVAPRRWVIKEVDLPKEGQVWLHYLGHRLCGCYWLHELRDMWYDGLHYPRQCLHLVDEANEGLDYDDQHWENPGIHCWGENPGSLNNLQ